VETESVATAAARDIALTDRRGSIQETVRFPKRYPGVTVALRVTDWPTFAGFGTRGERRGGAAAGRRNSPLQLIVFEVLELKLLSPR